MPCRTSYVVIIIQYSIDSQIKYFYCRCVHFEESWFGNFHHRIFGLENIIDIMHHHLASTVEIVSMQRSRGMS